jgi:hypothetical protein
MAVSFSSISHHVRTTLASTGTPAPLGHVHQFVAATLGYNSYAAYKTSPEEPPAFDDAVHIVLDADRLQQRQAELSFPAPLISIIRNAFAAALPGAHVHEGQDGLEATIHAEVANDIDTSDDYASEQAMTNAYGGDYDLTFHAPVALDVHAVDWVLEAEGASSLDQDPDRIYHGDVINVGARVVFAKLGRRLLGEHETQDVGAAIVDVRDADDEAGWRDEPEPSSPG